MIQQKGFERENKFLMLLGDVRADFPAFKASTLKKIICEINPEFLDGLFEPKPFVRKLKYLGCPCDEQPCPHEDNFFKAGNIYESIDFTGSTYLIAGAGDRRIGESYFEIVED